MTFYTWLKNYYDTYHQKASEIRALHMEYLMSNKYEEPALATPEDEEYAIDWSNDKDETYEHLANEGIDDTVFAVWERVKGTKDFPKRYTNRERILEFLEYAESPYYIICPMDWVMDALDMYERECRKEREK